MIECPICEATMIGVEYSYDSPEHYDGISEYYCMKCKIRRGRWSGKILKGELGALSSEVETRYGVTTRKKTIKKAKK